MGMTAMKTRSLGIAFAALLAFAPVRGNAGQTAGTAAPANAATSADPGERQTSVPRPAIVPKTSDAASATETTPRKPRKKNLRRFAYWEPFPVYWPSYHRRHLTWQRIAWFSWF
jgi:hypothetical protein